MIHISESLDKVMIDITVRAMLNPDNPDFYIGSLTLDKLKSLFVEMNDTSISAIDIFWKAFHIASAKYKEKERVFKKELEEILTFNSSSCPNCGCSEPLGYKPGLRCPNCDYIEE
jgi:hypothetical protein